MAGGMGKVFDPTRRGANARGGVTWMGAAPMAGGGGGAPMGNKTMRVGPMMRLRIAWPGMRLGGSVTKTAPAGGAGGGGGGGGRGWSSPFSMFARTEPDDGRRIDATARPARTAVDWTRENGGLAPDYSGSFGGLSQFYRSQTEPTAQERLQARAVEEQEAAGGFRLEARAAGGPVSPFQPYVVGERGPEVVIPTTPGVVIPNEMLPTTVKAGPTENVLELKENPYGTGWSYGAGMDVWKQLEAAAKGQGAAAPVAAPAAQTTAAPGAAAPAGAGPFDAFAKGVAAAQQLQQGGWQPGDVFAQPVRRPGPEAGPPSPWDAVTGAMNPRMMERQARRLVSSPQGFAMLLEAEAESEAAAARRRWESDQAVAAERGRQARELERQNRMDQRAVVRREQELADRDAEVARETQTKGDTMAVDLAGQQARFASLVQSGVIPQEAAVAVGRITHPEVMKQELDRWAELGRLEKQNAGKPATVKAAPKEVPEGYEAVPESFNEAGEVTGWKVEKKRRAPEATSWKPQSFAEAQAAFTWADSVLEEVGKGMQVAPERLKRARLVKDGVNRFLGIDEAESGAPEKKAEAPKAQQKAPPVGGGSGGGVKPSGGFQKAVGK